MRSPSRPRLWGLRVWLYTFWWHVIRGREVGVCEWCEFHPYTMAVLPRERP